jgi:hypothetical protein
MVKELIGLMNAERPVSAKPLDKDKCTIRCLPHVLHLAVTDLLKALKSLAKDDELDIVQDPLTEEEAERLHAERMPGEGVDDEQHQLSDADLGYAILKVSHPFLFSSVY